VSSGEAVKRIGVWNSSAVVRRNPLRAFLWIPFGGLLRFPSMRRRWEGYCFSSSNCRMILLFLIEVARSERVFLSIAVPFII